LILRQGSQQHFDSNGVLQYVTFTEYVFDLTPYVSGEDEVHFKNSDRYLHELLFPDLTQYWDRKDRKQFLAEAHARLSSPFYNLALMSLALTGVLGGSFSRTGYGRRIAIVCATAGLVRILGFGAQAACAANPSLNILQYLIPLVPTLVAMRQVLGPGVQGGRTLKAVGALQPIEAL
jgi:lipopolysaccharide export system permease protein